ncbi:MAG: FecR domain-containing protein [Treponema sp.]|nr:FecR domain-containing protein [Treponema sp.]
MKRFILSIIFAALTSSLFAMQAQVVSATGKAEVQKGSSWAALKAGDVLDAGSVIQTGFKSELVLKIKESTVTVSALTRITLQTLAEREGISGSQGKDETTIFLDTGSLKSNVQKSADRRVGFTVRSPVATASVRGTALQFIAGFKKNTLKTDRGKVAFGRTGKQEEPEALLVVKGETASIGTGNEIKTPEMLAKEMSSNLGFGTFTASEAERGMILEGNGGQAKNAKITGMIVFDSGD